MQTSYKVLFDFLITLGEEAQGKPGEWWQMETELLFLVFLPPLCIPSTSLLSCLPQTLVAGLLGSVSFLPLPLRSRHSPLPSPSCPGPSYLGARSLCLWFTCLPLALPQGYSELTAVARRITALACLGFRPRAPMSLT